jgi:hypothetical protein
MTPAEQREQLRLSLLRLLATNPTQFGVPVSFLRVAAAVEGRPGLTHEAVQAEVTYLADAGLAARVEKVLSPENACWRITKQGRDFLAERGIE